jgi:hypothetical protein
MKVIRPSGSKNITELNTLLDENPRDDLEELEEESMG